ncbi:MAG TPA: Hsp20/alpha crystallin family protein [Candidatus Polarisedimenticolia bacterium]|nr:Hsp20/alpha crystallin family protein [Candidatus Polarisedimenticolia bacterium]
MSLTRWDPFRDLVSLQERMNRLFEDSLSRSKTTDQEMAMGAWTPAVDIYETPEEVVLKADLPGVLQGEIDVQIENSTLTLRGERKFHKETKEEDYHRIERSYGHFSRSFQLPGSIDQTRISATHKEGVLEVHLPKREDTRPRQIKVDVKK